MVRQWFREMLDYPGSVVLYNLESVSIIYKGLKLTDTSDGRVVLQDCRRSNFYSRVSKADKRLLKRLGFPRGADTIQYRRDKFRVIYYGDYVARLTKQRDRFQARFDAGLGSPARNKKNVEIAQRRILKYADHAIYYENRVRAFQSKYK